MTGALPKASAWEDYLALPDTVMAEFIDRLLAEMED